MWLSLAGAALGTGCFSPPAQAVARLEQVKQDGAALEQASDALEARFLGNQANLQLWEELRRRHGQASEVVARNQSEHAQDMMRLLVAQEEKARRLHGGGVASTATYFSRAVVAAAPQKVGSRVLRVIPHGR